MDRPRPSDDHVSHDGRFRVRWSVADVDGGFVEQPRLLDERTGAVLLDLWAEPGHTGSLRRAAGSVVELSLTRLGAAPAVGRVVIDADARTYRMAERHGSLVAVRASLRRAGLADAGQPEPVLRGNPDGGPAPGADWAHPPDDETVDGRFRVAWTFQSEGHGAVWPQPRVTDARSGAVLLDLDGEATWDHTGEVVRSAGPVVEVWVSKLGRGGACTVAIDADAGTFEIRPIHPAGATFRALAEALHGRGLTQRAG